MLSGLTPTCSPVTRRSIGEQGNNNSYSACTDIPWYIPGNNFQKSDRYGVSAVG